jgi:hypothetical protein
MLGRGCILAQVMVKVDARWNTHQKHSIYPFPRVRHSIQVMVCEAVQDGGLVLNALVAVRADRLNGHGGSASIAHASRLSSCGGLLHRRMT